MPAIFIPDKIKGAMSAATSIHADATWLTTQPGGVNFTDLSDRLDRMRQRYEEGVQPLLDVAGASAVNAIIPTFTAGLPADAYGAFQTLATAMNALFTAYDTEVFDTLTVYTYDEVAGIHVPAVIPNADLASLADEANAIIAAADLVRKF